MLIPDDKTVDGSTVAPSSEASISTDASTARPTTYPPEKELPPPYPASGSSTSPAAGPSDFEADRPLLQKSNYLEIKRNDSSIKGSWLVDTDLQVPPSLLPPLEEGMERPHLHLSTKDGTINARIELCGGEAKERANLVMESGDGTVTCRLTNDQNQKIDLRCTSKDGGIYVYLHRGFRGPVKATTGNGNIIFSPEINRMMTTFMERDGTRLSFLGPFEGSGYSGEDEEWKGDKLHAETKDGSVRIYYLDEETSPSDGSATGSNGFWSRLFS